MRAHTAETKGLLPDPAFWAGKSVFLTGHTGFKGTWLTLWLERLGARVTGYSLAPDTSPSLFDLIGSRVGVESAIGDIRDMTTLEAAMTRARPDIVLHLAAQALVRRSYMEPLETMDTNVIGTARVLDACRRVESIRAVVVVTTDKCYENREWHWPYRENEALGGHDPYSASKACAEIVAAAWRNSFLAHRDGAGVNVATARAGNVIGGGDWAEDRLLPDCARALSSGQPVGIRNPHSTRPWQHVLEPLCGYLLLAERLCGHQGRDFAEAWNFGPSMSDVEPVLRVVEHAVAAWGEGARFEIIGSDHRHEASFLAVDATKARARMFWKPRLNLAQAVHWTMDWYRRFYDGESAFDLGSEQIAAYENVAENAYA